MSRRRALAVIALLLAPLVACGRKAPPLPPDRPVPVAPAAVVARRVDDRVELQFTVPAKNTNGTTPAAISRIDVFAQSLAPGQKAPRMELLTTSKHLIGHVDVKPAPDESAAATDAPPDPRPAPGDPATFVETSPPPAPPLAPVPAARARRGATVVPAASGTPAALPQRVYALVGIAGTKRHGAASGQLAVVFGDVPPAPTGATWAYDQTTVTLTWDVPPPPVAPVAPATTPPAGAANATASTGAGATGATTTGTSATGTSTTAASTAATTSSSTPATSATSATSPQATTLAPPPPPPPPPPTYRVYAVDHDGKEKPGGSLTAAPLAAPPFTMPVVFGKELCLVVRAVVTSGVVATESAPSETVNNCRTPVDTFPPPVPTNLSAVPDTGVVQLAWRPVVAPDLAGYVVLRREVGSATLQRLTASPIPATTWDDSTVRAGVDYEYVVRAVDLSKNESADSNKVIARAGTRAPHKD